MGSPLQEDVEEISPGKEPEKEFFSRRPTSVSQSNAAENLVSC